MGLNPTYIQGYASSITSVINGILVPVLISLAFIVFLWGIYNYFIAGAADEKKRTEGRTFALYGLIGFVVLFSVWGIVNIFMGTLNLSSSNVPAMPTIGNGTGANSSLPTSGTGAGNNVFTGIGGTGGSGTTMNAAQTQAYTAMTQAQSASATACMYSQSSDACKSALANYQKAVDAFKATGGSTTNGEVDQQTACESAGGVYVNGSCENGEVDQQQACTDAGGTYTNGSCYANTTTCTCANGSACPDGSSPFSCGSDTNSSNGANIYGCDADTSCTSWTCSYDTCTDSCGNTWGGTLDCSGTGG